MLEKYQDNMQIGNSNLSNDEEQKFFDIAEDILHYAHKIVVSAGKIATKPEIATFLHKVWSGEEKLTVSKPVETSFKETKTFKKDED